ncbi:MAG: hypothetical protein K6F97_02585 [Lachnospiraceae bacterium]|nr:hypothetical protein [Lachnospiraceae bacterium]
MPGVCPYILSPAFLLKVNPEYVSCLIQINVDDKQWVSDSPYLHAFDRLDEVHHQIDENSLLTKMQETGYKDILQARVPLPNGKALIRIDFRKECKKDRL